MEHMASICLGGWLRPKIKKGVRKDNPTAKRLERSSSLSPSRMGSTLHFLDRMWKSVRPLGFPNPENETKDSLEVDDCIGITRRESEPLLRK